MTSQSSFKGRISKVAFAAAILCAAEFIYALPAGGVVSSGAANMATNGLVTTIQQSSQNAAINWLSFNLAASETVRVVQPNASSVLLNRVMGTQPSEIFGKLSANGQVFLINPNGILFGSGASVNTAGFVATTLNLSDADFAAGRYQFAGASTAGVVNQGTLKSEGGYVALLGASVDNQGTIQANAGTVALAAGHAMTLEVLGDGLLNVQITQGAINALAQNGGLIQADGGTIVMTAQSASDLMQSVVNTTGVLQAQSFENLNGIISLIALGPNSTVNAAGSLDVSGLAPGQKGGHVELKGQQVGVFDARIVASGDAAGGSVLVGGQTLNALGDQAFTRATYVSAGSVLQADAITQGPGGNVIIKATDVTRAQGQISARGGAAGGNGGFIETSAAYLGLSGLRVDASAPTGKRAHGCWTRRM